MGPGFKYHVVTVAAIFFALTVGLVIGSLYVSPQLADQQKRAISDLRVALDNDVREQREHIKHYKEFFDQSLPALVQRRLVGVSVALVQVGDYPELLAKVRETLLLADATILSETTLDNTLARPDELLKATLDTIHAETPIIPTDRTELARVLASLLTGAAPSPETMLTPLTRANLIRTSRDSDYTRPARYVIMVGGSRDENSLRPENLDAPLIAELQKLNVTVVMCEPLEAKFSDILAYRNLKLNVSTVDNADHDIGLCALIYSLRGERGAFGVKETASRLFPTSNP